MSMRSLAGWNYRALRYKDGAIGLHEVYYDAETGAPTSCTENPVGVVGDDLAEMQEVLNMMSKGLAAEVLDYEAFLMAGERQRPAPPGDRDA